ncbi:hypothetical protein HOK68_02610 [Candidatus Woesearchaeota archaeon]|jgi:chromosome segregation ATPase|nr:hypothetical protein [Candidatus Woesearchaeota archaeon]MBT4387956.1 hypothetical protein [Candidatus Woesearchaeota archaeon]MBT4595300.1 hypothetical protein [Candidatus Woesearchaeota archaeon]MBT5741502.1 hypothetical protein [Candidatus Woesearchaeota archaeon]MBT6505644.1 hypothetical protein [Candidatus Woesearchaeota archaeon]
MEKIIRKIDGMNTKVKEGFVKVRHDISSVVNKQSEFIDFFSKKIADVERNSLSKKEVSKVDVKVNDVHTQISDLQEAVDQLNIESELREMKNLVLDKKTLDSEYANISELNKLEAELNKLTDAIESLKEKLSKSENFVTKDNLKEISESIMIEVGDKFNPLKEQNENLLTTVQDLKNNFETFKENNKDSSSISLLKDDMDLLKNKVSDFDDLNENLEQLNSLKSDFETFKSDNDDSLANLKNNVMNDIRNEMSSLRSELEILKENSVNSQFEDQFRDSVADINNSIGELKHNLDDVKLSNDDSNASQRLEVLEGTVKNVEFDTQKELLNFSSTFSNYITKDHLDSQLLLFRQSMTEAMGEIIDERSNGESFYDSIDEKESKKNVVKKSIKKETPKVLKEEVNSNDNVAEVKEEKKSTWNKIVDFFIDDDDE